MECYKRFTDKAKDLFVRLENVVVDLIMWL